MDFALVKVPLPRLFITGHFIFMCCVRSQNTSEQEKESGMTKDETIGVLFGYVKCPSFAVEFSFSVDIVCLDLADLRCA